MKRSSAVEGPFDMRRLIDEVVACVQPLSADPLHWNAEERTLLTGLREEFIAAGAAHLERLHNPGRWLQVGLYFETQADRDAFLRDPLRRAVGRWLREGRIQQFSFLLKAPGLRVRFGGLALERNLMPRLQALLQREQKAQRLAGQEYGVYDAETYQFGGVQGLEIAHEFFTADSLVALDLLKHHVPEDALPVLSLTVMNDLVARICSDPWERWDAWRNLELARPMVRDPAVLMQAKASLAEQRDVLAQTVWEPAAVLAQLSPAMRRPLLQYFDANQRVADRLLAAARSGQLLYGARKIFPFYAIFHWNRWNIPFAMQTMLAFFMQQILDPKGA